MDYKLFYSCTLYLSMCVCVFNQGIPKDEVLLYHWPPVWLVRNQLYDNCQFLFLLEKQANPNQSNRRSTVPWYFPLNIPWLNPCTACLLSLCVYYDLYDKIKSTNCGRYYKPLMIVNDDSRVINNLEASLTDDARVVTYDCHMLIVQDTGCFHTFTNFLTIFLAHYTMYGML
jgi:hypothetical protein